MNLQQLCCENINLLNLCNVYGAGSKSTSGPMQTRLRYALKWLKIWTARWILVEVSHTELQQNMAYRVYGKDIDGIIQTGNSYGSMCLTIRNSWWLLLKISNVKFLKICLIVSGLILGQRQMCITSTQGITFSSNVHHTTRLFSSSFVSE